MEQPRATMAGDGKKVHLVAHAHDGTVPVTLCDEKADRYREPVPGAPLCENCAVTLAQLRQAAERIRGGAR